MRNNTLEIRTLSAGPYRERTIDGRSLITRRTVRPSVIVAAIGLLVFGLASVVQALTPAPRLTDADRAAMDALVRSVMSQEG